MSNIVIFKRNGNVISPDHIEEMLHNATLTPQQLRDSSWQIGELSSTLTLEYGGWTYECVPHIDICDDLDWPALNDWDVSVKWHEMFIGQSTYELPDFDPPESVDCKRPDRIDYRADYEWSTADLQDLLDMEEWEGVLDTLYNIDSCEECGCLNEDCVCVTEDDE